MGILDMLGGGVFLDQNGIPTLPDGTPALEQNRGPAPYAPSTPAPPPGPDGLLAQLAAQGTATQMVPAFLAREQDHYVDSSGNNLIGAPDENGMAAMAINPDGTPASPQFFGQGPPYNDSSLPYTGGAPMTYNDTGANHDSGVPSDWEQYKGNATTGGGFFTLDDVYASQGKDLPTAFQSGSNMPSTNNWRLLPVDYRRPNYIMRNGRIIDLNSGEMRGSSVYGGGWSSGASMGFPSAYPVGNPSGNNMAFVGWPGQVSNWMGLGPATTS